MARIIDTDYLIKSSLHFLKFRPRSVAETRRFLLKKTKNVDLVERVITRLCQTNLLNDREFTSWYISSRQRTKPRGIRLLSAELRNKGINLDEEMSVFSPDNEIELARIALNKKMKIWANLPYKQFFQKSSRFLMSRGFSWPVVESVIKTRYNERHVN